MDPVATALAKALLGPSVKSAGQRLGELAFGPRHEAALRKVYECTLDSVISSGLSERTPREERDHVRWVVGQAVEVAVEADIFDGAAGAAPLDGLLQRLRDPSLGIEIDTLDALGVNAVELLSRFLDEFPGCLQKEAQRPDSPLFHFAVLRQFDAVRAQVDRIAETVGLLPPQVGEQDRIRVLGGEGWVRTLTVLYPNYPLVSLFGHRAAACVFPALPDEWHDLEASLGSLHGTHVPAHDGWSDEFDPVAHTSFRGHLATARARRKWNGAAFALQRMRLRDSGVRIDCKPGRYFQSLATSEECDAELMAALSTGADDPVGLDRLPRRKWAHDHAQGQDPVVDGTGRSEELYSIEEYEVGSEPLHDLEAEPEIVRLNRLVEKGLAGLYYTGVSVNLLTLRPEICTLLLVRDQGWLASESVAAQRAGRPWKLAWEWLARHDEHQLPSGRSHHQFLALDDELRPVSPDNSALRPAALIPNAAAAIALALPVARQLLGERTEAG